MLVGVEPPAMPRGGYGINGKYGTKRSDQVLRSNFHVVIKDMNTNVDQLSLLILNQTLLDTRQEYEILAEGDLLLTVDIVFTDTVAFPVRHEFVTELHWRYATSNTAPRMAIESDILASGQTHAIAEIAFLRVFGLSYSVNRSLTNP